VETSLEQKDAKGAKCASRDLSGESRKSYHGFSFCLMGQEHLESAKIQLAVALAKCIVVTKWARARDILRPTVWRCSIEPHARSMTHCETATVVPTQGLDKG
jgi:hypothetical protein